MFAKAQRVHFIGIGGIGMSGIAEILLNLGYAVSGSDLRRSSITERLATLGAIVFEGHAAANVVGSGVVVTSSAVNERNPEVIEARSRKIPVIQRAEMLAELMRLKYGIAVAGMHGKTTTTSMIATVLAAGNLDPTVVVGGRVDALGSNARLGKSQYLVAEADESDRSFLKLSPILAVVTNLDREHMDCYRDMADIEDAFVEFMDRVPFYGSCVACIDNEQLANILPRVRRRVFTYGTTPKADFITRMLPPCDEARARFEVAIAQGLQSFRGVDRRFQLKGCERGVAVIDDYGHHPTEIRATLHAARECNYRQVHVIFQPHRYSRTRDLMQEFLTAFEDANKVEMLDIYAASEEPIPGITAKVLVEAMHQDGVEYAASFEEAIDRVVANASEGDAIFTLGAGNVSQLAPQVLEKLKSRV
jgi:UDP-N-acetylmuramate--alanine ligase